MTATTLTLLCAGASLHAERRRPAPVPQCAAPSSLSGYAMTYDPDRRQVVIFGGVATGDIPSNDTWGWDGREWHCIAAAGVSGPRPRDAAMLGYDARRHVLVLYGGRAGRQPFRDTWELGATGWSLRDSAGPTPDPHGVLAWDAGTGGVLLYHSLGDDGPTRTTWRWDGRNWIKVVDGPNGEFPDAMFASDGSRPATLMTAQRIGTSHTFTAPIYQWQRDRWIPVAVTGAAPAFSPQAPAARTPTGALLFAGFEPGGGSVTTSVLEGTIWRTHVGSSPSRRKGAQMILDPVRRIVVLHGGDDGQQILDDTWEWNGKEWRRVR